MKLLNELVIKNDYKFTNEIRDLKLHYISGFWLHEFVKFKTMSGRNIICIVLTLVTVQMTVSDEEHNFNLVCEKIYVGPDNNVTRCLSPYTEIKSPTTIIGKVLHTNGSKIDTKNISMWQILRNSSSSVKFIPAGIKKKFSKLSIFVLHGVGLIHLEREDMRQFGKDLIRVEFNENLLTALEDDIFELNPNVEYVNLKNNPLKFVSSVLFKSLRKMENIKNVDIRFGCATNSHSWYPKTENWNYENSRNCNDEKIETENVERISERILFFIEVFPELNFIDQQKIKTLQTSNNRLQFELNETKLKLAELEEFFEILS